MKNYRHIDRPIITVITLYTVLISRQSLFDRWTISATTVTVMCDN